MKKYYITSIIILLYIPIITIGAELVKPVKDFLANTFWHHWLGKSVVLIVLYAVIMGLLSFKKTEEDEKSDAKYFNMLMIIGIVGVLSVFGFFVYEYLKHV